MTDVNFLVAPALQACTKSFEVLIRSLTKDSHGAGRSIGNEQTEINQALGTELEDCAGRLRIWSSNIGAHQMDKNSLDYRLRDAQHIKTLIGRLLQDLNAFLLEIQLITKGSELPPAESTDSDSEDSEVDHNEIEQGTPSRARSIVHDVSQIVTLLFKLSRSLRKSRWSNRYSKSEHIDVSHYEQYYISHIKEKFPKVPTFLMQRLAQGLLRRRQYFMYREMHAAKLAHDEEVDAPAPSETMASTFVDPQTNKAYQAASTDLEDLQSVMSETSFAASVGTSGTISVPSMPREAADGQHFECPFCRKIEVVKDTHAWKKHVYRDLEPYQCTFEKCQTPLQTYGSRRHWFRHELDEHCSVWTCGTHCEQLFQSSGQLSAHLRQFLKTVPDSQLAVLTSIRKAPVPKDAVFTCEICSSSTHGRTAFMRHKARHLEQLALFTLPKDTFESGEDADSLPSAVSLPSSLAPSKSPEAFGLASDNTDSGMTGSVIDEEYAIKCICGSRQDDGILSLSNPD
ncbi:MAG: hypothetical protein MMC33_004321 [Icmadophila ericetorum]|nr:hypothetical protein [Icmadophila ericetorum]